jgi:Flp pilus assembly protein TadD
MRLGKYPEALDAGRAALGLIPDDAATQFDVGCAWANLGRPNEAIRQYQMLLALKPPRPLELEARLYLNRLQAGRP